MNAINYNKPLTEDDGFPQIRLTALMYHPEYRTFDGVRNVESPGYRNGELNAMSTRDVILDARNVIERLIASGDAHWNGPAGANFYHDVWNRAKAAGIVSDEDET